MSMACWVYALSSVSRNHINVGLSTNAVNRIEEHQRVKEKTMDAYRPFAVLLFERFETRPVAREREKFLKSGRGKAFLKDLRTRFTGESTPTQVAESVDASVSNTDDASRAGSSPALGTTAIS